MRWLLPLFAAVGLSQLSLAQSVRLLTADAADCDAIRTLNFDLTCDVNTSLAQLSPPRVLSLCEGADAAGFIARLSRSRPDFYVTEEMSVDTSVPGGVGGCQEAEFVILLAQQDATPQGLVSSSTGVLPQDLRARPVLDDAGRSLPPTDLSQTRIRLSGSGEDFDAFCAVLGETWQGLRCDHTVGSARNVIMISCPRVPLGTAQVLANLFQTSFQTFDWRDDAAACNADHGVDVELGGFISWPDATQIDLALNKPVSQEVELRTLGDLPALEPIESAPAPVALPHEARSQETQIDEITAMILLEELQGLPIRLQFKDAVDARLCEELRAMSFRVTCDTAVSENRPNFMMRCPRLDLQTAQAFVNFIGLEGAHAWDWRERHDNSACRQDNAFEIEITGQSLSLPEPLETTSNTGFGLAGPNLILLGEASTRIAVNAENPALCDHFRRLGFDVSCGQTLSEPRTNITLSCETLPDDVLSELLTTLAMVEEDVQIYDWRTRQGLAARACDSGPAFAVELAL